MNDAPEQMPLAPPEGLVSVSPQNLEAGKHYFVTLVEIVGGEVVPNDTPWWDFVSLRELTPESITFDRIKTLMAGPHGQVWYTLDLVDDPDEVMDMTQPRNAFIESTQGQPDGQYFIFYRTPQQQQQQQQQQQAGRRRKTRRAKHRRRTRKRSVYSV